MAEDGANKKTNELLAAYESAVLRKVDAENALEKAKRNLEEATRALGEHMVPEDARIQETFSIWVREKDNVERLLCVTKTSIIGFDIQIRNGRKREG